MPASKIKEIFGETLSPAVDVKLPYELLSRKARKRLEICVF